MTIINPKSIAGVTSITTPSGSDNLFTVHTNNTTERVRINNDGDVIVGSGITVSPDGDIFATGVTTATTFVGALTGNVTGTIQTAAQSNITSVGTLTGLTVGGDISVTGDIKNGTSLIDITQNDRIEVDIAGTEIVDINGNGVDVVGGVDISGTLKLADAIQHTGDTNTQIRFPADDTVSVETAGSERLRITSDGKVAIGEDDPDGNYLLIRAASTVGTINGHIMLTGDSATVGQGPQIVFSESGSGSSNAGAYIGHIRQGSNSIGDLVFGTRGTSGDANTVPTERVRIDSSGNLKFNSGYGSVVTAYGVRAWLKMYWDSGTPTISGSGNVSSLTDTATGDVTINLTTALPDTVYATCVSGDEYGQSQAPSFNTGFTSRGYSTTAITVNATNHSGTSTDIKSVQVIVVR